MHLGLDAPGALPPAVLPASAVEAALRQRPTLERGGPPDAAAVLLTLTVRATGSTS